MLLLPVVLFASALMPIPVLAWPLVLLPSAVPPNAVLSPLVLLESAEAPTAVLKLPLKPLLTVNSAKDRWRC